MKTYNKNQKHRNSGVEWLRQIPAQWKIMPLRSIAKENNNKNSNGLCTNLLSLSYGKIIEKNIESNSGLLPESFNTYQIVKTGNIVLRLTDLQNDKVSLRVGYVDTDKPGIITSAYLALDLAERMNPKYTYFLLHAYDIQKVFYAMGGGVRQTLDYKNFKYLPILVPDIDLQAEIAKYLEKKINLIDQTISKKKQLIDLLQEKRTSMINITIRTNIGEKLKIKHCSLVNPSTNYITKNLKDDEIVSFIPMEAISETGELKLQEKTYSAVQSGFTTFRNEDVVLAKITPCYENGKAGVIRGLKNNIGFGTTEFIVLRPNQKIIPDYLYYLIYSDSFRRNGEVVMKGSAGQKRVTKTFVSNYEFYLPDLPNQKKIIETIKNQSNQINRARTILENQINLLKEYRSSLIYHAVTGKIKV